MHRFFFLSRSLIIVVIVTLISATLNIQAAPLLQSAGPDHRIPRVRDAENLPRLPGVETSVNSPDIIDAVAIYPWSRLAFQSFRDNNWEVYLGNDDGSGQARLTNNGDSDIHPRLNRGATRIAFASRRTGNYEIYTMNVDGTGLTRLTQNSADDVQPYWSPDGSKIAFQSYRDGQAEVYVMNADGSGQTRLTTNSDYDGEPAWSPNGAKIAFVSKRSGSGTDYHIWVMNADGTGQIQLTSQEYCEGPVWSPDGTKIAYDASGSDYWQNLWIVNADGSNPHVVFDEGGYADAWARSWSPDGRYVAFTRIYYTIYNNQLYWTNAYLDAWDSTTNNTVRLSSNGLDWRPDWQSTDAAAPSSAVNALPATSPGPFRVRWSGTDSGGSGLKNFDIQVKDGVNGAWTMWQTQTTGTSAYYPGVGGHTYYFRSRARDNAGNVEIWPTGHDAVTTVESLAPVGAIETLPPFSKNTVTVKWGGNDPGGSGIQTYDVQYQDVTTGIQWLDWQIGVSTTMASFIGTTGHTYAFRVRALDRAQNQGDWSSVSGDAQTTFYAWAVSGKAHNNTGSPLVGVEVETEPSAQGVFADALDGQYAAYVITPSTTYTVSWAKDGYGNLPATAFQDSPNTSIVYQGTLSAQGDIVTVSGLEVGQTYRIVVTGTYQYAGWSGAWDDAQWGIDGSCAPGVFCVYDRHVKFNGILLAAQNGQDAVDPNHEYTFLWTADAPQLQMQIADSTYFDNSGALSFKISPVNSASLYQGELPAQGDIVTLGGFQVNQTYRIIMRGMFEFSIGGGSWADAQWTTWSCPPMILCTYFRAVSFNGVQLAALNGQGAVDPNHEYTFLWTADAPQLQMYILDSDYRDNSGHLTFEIFSDDASSDLNVFLPPADDLIVNGQFESEIGTVSDWIASGTITPATTSLARHTGRRSVLLGSSSVTATTDSTIAQAVTIPSTMTTPVLSFLYRASGISSLENGLVSYWKLDEATGDALDALGTNTLTATNAPGSTPGSVQTARKFSGDHQCFSVPTRPSVEVGDTSFTFTAWGNLANKTDYHDFIGKHVENFPYYDRDYSFSYDKDMDRIYFQVAGPDGFTLTRAIANSLGSPATNTWYFLAGGYDLTNGYIWISVNGGPKETTPFTGSVHVGQAPFMLGGEDNPLFGYHAGLLDEVGFWKRALTPEEIATLYNNGQGLSYPFNSFGSGGELDVQVTDSVTTTTVFTTAAGTADWTHEWLDLSEWKGQPITVTFILHGTENSPAAVYLDEVTLGSGYPDTWIQLANQPVAQPGSTVVYQLTYGNQGGALASEVQLTATLPAELTFVEASSPPTSTTPSLVWNLGDLLAQSGPHSILITATVTPTVTSISSVTSTVNIATATAELEKANNTDQTSLTIKHTVFLPIIALD